MERVYDLIWHRGYRSRWPTRRTRAESGALLRGITEDQVLTAAIHADVVCRRKLGRPIELARYQSAVADLWARRTAFNVAVRACLRANLPQGDVTASAIRERARGLAATCPKGWRRAVFAAAEREIVEPTDLDGTIPARPTGLQRMAWSWGEIPAARRPAVAAAIALFVVGTYALTVYITARISAERDSVAVAEPASDAERVRRRVDEIHARFTQAVGLDLRELGVETDYISYDQLARAIERAP